MEYGNLKLAIRYAKRIMKDGAGKTPTEIAPETTVFALVEEIDKVFAGGNTRKDYIVNIWDTQKVKCIKGFTV